MTYMAIPTIFSRNKPIQRKSIMAHLLLYRAPCLVSAVLIGILVGINPGFALKFGILLCAFLFFVNACNFPKLENATGKSIKIFTWALILASVFWPVYAIFKVPGLPSIDPKKLIIAALIFTWLFSIVTSTTLWPELKSRLHRLRVHSVLIFLFMLTRLLSALTSQDIVFSLIQFAWEFLTFYLIFFSAVSCLKSHRDLRKTAYIVVASAALISIIAIAERFVGHNLISGLFPISPEYADIQTAALEEKIRSGANRVQATFEHPMALAEFLTFSIPITFFVLLRRRCLPARVLALCTIPLVFTAIYYSGTRSALITAGGLLLLLFALLFMRKVVQGGVSIKTYFSMLGLIAVIVIGVVSLTFATELIQGRTNIEQLSSLARIRQLELGFPKILEHPVLGYGVGLGNSVLGFVASRGRLSTDNYYLTLALDSGITAVAFFVLLLGAYFLTGLRLYFSQDRDTSMLSGMLAISIAGVAVIKIVLSIHYNLIFIYLAFAMIAILKGLPTLDCENQVNQ